MSSGAISWGTGCSEQEPAAVPLVLEGAGAWACPEPRSANEHTTLIDPLSLLEQTCELASSGRVADVSWRGAFRKLVVRDSLTKGSIESLVKQIGHFITLGVPGTLMSQALHSVILGECGIQAAPRVPSSHSKGTRESHGRGCFSCLLMHSTASRDF